MKHHKLSTNDKPDFFPSDQSQVRKPTTFLWLIIELALYPELLGLQQPNQPNLLGLQQTPQPDLFGVQPQPTPAPVKSFKPQPEKQQENQLPSANLFDDFENLINDELLDPEILSIIQVQKIYFDSFNITYILVMMFVMQNQI